MEERSWLAEAPGFDLDAAIPVAAPAVPAMEAEPTKAREGTLLDLVREKEAGTKQSQKPRIEPTTAKSRAVLRTFIIAAVGVGVVVVVVGVCLSKMMTVSFCGCDFFVDGMLVMCRSRWGWNNQKAWDKRASRSLLVELRATRYQFGYMHPTTVR